MKAGVTCTDDVTKIHPSDGLGSELTIKGYLGVSVQPLLRTRSSASLDRSLEGSENMTRKRRQLHRAIPTRLPGFTKPLHSPVIVWIYQGGLTP